jgi:membrane carboxypeptidase/penicillin-binding protein
VVWLGFDEPRSLGIPSSQGALPIWRRFVQDLTGGEIRGSFRPPPGVETADIDPRSGALASWGCPERRSEYFLAGTLPVLTCPAGGVAGTRREPAEREEVERGFLEWLRRQL